MESPGPLPELVRHNAIERQTDKESLTADKVVPDPVLQGNDRQQTERQTSNEILPGFVRQTDTI